MAPPPTIEERAMWKRVRRDLFSVSSGTAVLEIPEPLNEADYDGLLAWLHLVTQRLSREAAPAFAQRAARPGGKTMASNGVDSLHQAGARMALREVQEAARRGAWDMTGLTPAAEED